MKNGANYRGKKSKDGLEITNHIKFELNHQIMLLMCPASRAANVSEAASSADKPRLSLDVPALPWLLKIFFSHV